MHNLYVALEIVQIFSVTSEFRRMKDCFTILSHDNYCYLLFGEPSSMQSDNFDEEHPTSSNIFSFAIKRMTTFIPFSSDVFNIFYKPLFSLFTNLYNVFQCFVVFGVFLLHSKKY